MFLVVLAAATFLCSLVAGFLFAFAVVAMPGIGRLGDREFIRAFQVMDRVIQNNHPLFLLVWVGSAVVLIVSLVMGFSRLTGIDLLLLCSAGAIYILGVQLPTIVINIPLNNQLQAVDFAGLEEGEAGRVRLNFEPRWNRWNRIRTLLSCAVASLLVGLLIRL